MFTPETRLWSRSSRCIFSGSVEVIYDGINDFKTLSCIELTLFALARSVYARSLVESAEYTPHISHLLLGLLKLSFQSLIYRRRRVCF